VQPTSPKRSANKDIDAGADKYKFVFRTGSELDGFIEQLNNAGEQGYRLKSAIYGAQRASAIYYALPVAILQLDEGQYQYAWFRTTSNLRFAISGYARENQLVFEQGAVGNGQRREYKVLKFEFQIGELLKLKNGAENKVQIELAPSSKEAMAVFKTLVKKGFVVRDLFVSDNIWKRISVLLERSRLPSP
jgi:hypothetical protein